MLQKEVAQRICAVQGDPNYGRLAVIVRWLAEPRLLFEVSATAFTPRPKVTSALVKIVPRSDPLHQAERDKLEAVSTAAFGQRRKMLRTSLKRLGGEILLKKAAINPKARPEELSLEDFCRLARAYSETA